MTDQRNHTIDLLRFLSALFVAFYHFNQPIAYVDNWYRNLLKLGYLGVPVFFVISGYSIILSASRSHDGRDFLTRRIFRIFPPYYISLLIVLLTIMLFRAVNGVNDIAVFPKTITGISATLLLLTSPFSSVPVINWVYWTLTYELFFYIIVAGGLFLPRKFRIIAQLLISGAALILPVYPSGLLFFLKYWPLFSLGMSIFYFDQEKPGFWPLLLAAVSLAGLVRLFLLAGGAPTFVATLLTAIMILISLKKDIKNNVFSRLGDLSYSVYLLHVPIGIYLLGQLKTKTIQEHIGYNLLFDLFCYLIVLSISLFSFRLVEKPAIRFGKSLSKKLAS